MKLTVAAPELERILTLGTATNAIAAPFSATELRHETLWVTMRDGIRLATDVYFPPSTPAPAIAIRTPYGRKQRAQIFILLARHGYIVLAQDCRGTGDSEPDQWDCYIHEWEDSADFVEWTTRQAWFNGFLAACGGSYSGSTQWAMAMDPRVSAIAPEVAGLVITPSDAPRPHMFVNAYSRSVGKGEEKVSIPYCELERLMLDETLASGYFNAPLDVPLSAAIVDKYPDLRTSPSAAAKRRLWEHYITLDAAGRADLIKLAFNDNSVTLASIEALPDVFGYSIPLGLFLFPCEGTHELVQSLRAPALVVAGWYDWNLRDTLATWELLVQQAPASVRARSRLLIAPSAHNVPGYHEGSEHHPELQRSYRLPNLVGLLLCWYEVAQAGAHDSWPTAIYYLMGANEWQAASAWPPPEARSLALHLTSDGMLTPQSPSRNSAPDSYIYDPDHPTPTVGGSIVSNVYTPGSVDVADIQRRADVLTYTTPPLRSSLDVVGPLRLILYVSSSAIDTDFSARLSDVFPDGRAIQLQSGMLRARYRDGAQTPEHLEPGRIYRLDIDMWATANRFKKGHRLRLDICSADFPRFDRNANRGGEPGPPIRATQTIYHDVERPSHLLLSVLNNGSVPGYPP